MEEELLLFSDDQFDEADTAMSIDLVSQDTLLGGELGQKSIKKGGILFHPKGYSLVSIPHSLPFASPEMSIDRKRWDVYLICLHFTLPRTSDAIQYQRLAFSIKLKNSNVLALELFPKEIDWEVRDKRYEPFPGWPIPFGILQPKIQAEGERYHEFEWVYTVTEPYTELAYGDRKVVVLLQAPRGTSRVTGTVRFEGLIREQRPMKWETISVNSREEQPIRWELSQAHPLDVEQHQASNIVVIVAASRVEYEAMRRHLTDPQEKCHPEGTIYERGAFYREGQSWEMILVEVDEHNTEVARETERALATFHPAIALFIGSAIGIKDVSPGDVVVACKTYNYESGQASTRFRTWPEAFQPTYAMKQRAQVEKRKGQWVHRLHDTPSHPSSACKVHLGAVASGDKELASSHSNLWAFLQSHYNDALAMDMQSLGFLKAMHANDAVNALVLHGIAQCIDVNDIEPAVGDTTFRTRAAQCACAFALEVLVNFGRSSKRCYP